MTWQYDQSSGELSHNGKIIWSGYSGKGSAKNNPAMEMARDAGPIPRGQWRITGVVPSNKGPHVIGLSPRGHLAQGRTLFRIHGESKGKPPGNASKGCIIAPLHARQMITASGDLDLVVVE